MSKKILVSGGNGRFANELKKINSRYQFIFRNKKQFNILSLKSIENNFKKFKPHIVLHLAGLSRPMSIHDKKINKSIDHSVSFFYKYPFLVFLPVIFRNYPV